MCEPAPQSFKMEIGCLVQELAGYGAGGAKCRRVERGNVEGFNEARVRLGAHDGHEKREKV